MKYKILVVKNRYTKKINLKKYGIDWFKKNTCVEVETEEIKTDFDLTFVSVGNATYKGWIVGPEVLPQLRSIIPEGKYHAVVLIYGNNVDGVRLSACNFQGPLYPETEFIQICKSDDSGKTMNHEMFHGFTAKAFRRGAPIIDKMDTYFRDNIFDLDNGDTNRVIALRDLAPYWDKVFDMKPASSGPTVTITREKETKKQVTGTLVATNGGATFTCKTLELPWKNNQKNVSCIPTGTYKVAQTYSPKFMKNTYEVLQVPTRSGIRIHSANYFSDLNGCIALGNGLSDINKDGELDTINSRITIAAFDGFMGKKDFTLIIK